MGLIEYNRENQKLHIVIIFYVTRNRIIVRIQVSTDLNYI